MRLLNNVDRNRIVPDNSFLFVIWCVSLSFCFVYFGFGFFCFHLRFCVLSVAVAVAVVAVAVAILRAGAPGSPRARPCPRAV